MCLSCHSAVETAEHVLNECEAYDTIRERIAKQLVATGLGGLLRSFGMDQILCSEPEVEQMVKVKPEKQKENFYSIIKGGLWAISKVRKLKAIESDDPMIKAVLNWNGK